MTQHRLTKFNKQPLCKTHNWNVQNEREHVSPWRTLVFLEGSFFPCLLKYTESTCPFLFSEKYIPLPDCCKIIWLKKEWKKWDLWTIKTAKKPAECSTKSVRFQIFNLLRILLYQRPILIYCFRNTTITTYNLPEKQHVSLLRETAS